MADDTAGGDYTRARAIYRLTQRAIAAVNLIVSKGPLSPLTGVQNLTLRVALSDVVREAIGVGKWLASDRKSPPPLPRSRPHSQTVVVSEDPHFDEDSTTEPVAVKR